MSFEMQQIANEAITHGRLVSIEGSGGACRDGDTGSLVLPLEVMEQKTNSTTV